MWPGAVIATPSDGFNLGDGPSPILYLNWQQATQNYTGNTAGYAWQGSLDWNSVTNLWTLSVTQFITVSGTNSDLLGVYTFLNGGYWTISIATGGVTPPFTPGPGPDPNYQPTPGKVITTVPFSTTNMRHVRFMK
jgi:hypothetical protein